MLSTVLKIIAALIGAAVAVVLIASSSLLFSLWPTGFSDHAISVTPVMLEQLAKMKDESKFQPDPDHFYFGTPNERIRAQSQAEVDAVVATLLADLPTHARRSFVLKTFKSALEKFDTVESEERDRFLAYLERIMSIVGVSDSGELLNVWRYGLPYGWMTA